MEKQILNFMWIENLGSFLAGNALTNERDWILSLFKPFISDGMMNKTLIRLRIFVLVVSAKGFPSWRRNCLSQFSTTMVQTSRILIIAQFGLI